MGAENGEPGPASGLDFPPKVRKRLMVRYLPWPL